MQVKSAADSRIFVMLSEDGSFAGAYIEGANITADEIEAKLEEGAVEVTYDEYQKLCGNDPDGVYIRDPETKNFILKPPYVPTADDKLAALDAEYEAKFAEINEAILLAVAENDTVLQSELIAEKTALKAEYEQKRGEI